nr:hypothetical protein [uncultured Mediterraneibacter sp.]
MEWCVTFGEEWHGAKYVHRFVRTVFVFILLTTAVVWVITSEAAEREKHAAGDGVFFADAAAGWESVAEGILDPLKDSAVGIVSDTAGAVGFVPEKTLFSVAFAEEPSVLSAPEISVLPEREEPVLPVPDAPSLPEPEVSDSAADALPLITDDTTDEPAKDTVSPAVPQEPQPDTADEVIGGFLVNESGIIYGIADPAAAISAGIMNLPEEGCTGIASGAFSAGFPSVREVYIPPNITYIESGAFTGLENVEWFGVKSEGIFSANMGVLLSEEGTCILAFPAGRIGSYKVPSQITKFAKDAFEDSSLTTIDMTSCTMSDTGNVPDNIRLLQRNGSEVSGI